MVNQSFLYFTLAVATFAVSWAAILIKLADASPLPIAFYRMALSSLLLAIPAIPKVRETYRALNARQIWLLIASGVVLGLHFAFWVTSLFYTTISNSTILVATQPIFILIMEALFFKDKIPSRSIIGMGVAIIGMAIISGGDFKLGKDFIIGDLLALAGAFCAGTYLLIGRHLRAKIDTLGYIFPVYTIAALTLLVCSLFCGENLTSYPLKTWGIFLLLAIIPTIMGHSLYNWLLKYVPAHKVATTILGEPIGATLLAIIFFNQIPGWWTIGGGILILSGIFIVLGRKAESPAIA
jgi:drug/metabolite transporter (DMT)-like permease